MDGPQNYDRYQCDPHWGLPPVGQLALPEHVRQQGGAKKVLRWLRFGQGRRR